MLPPYDSRTTLAVLATSLARLRPDRVICLGDSFHDAQASDRLSPQDRAVLGKLVSNVDWIWAAAFGPIGWRALWFSGMKRNMVQDPVRFPAIFTQKPVSRPAQGGCRRAVS
tara:strand:- start:3347 stop:3682 length:336 start_codon:yes stop_codon:yes gene_type:complete